MKPRHPDAVVLHHRVRECGRERDGRVRIGRPESAARGELPHQAERLRARHGPDTAAQLPELLQQLVPAHQGLLAGALRSTRSGPAGRGERRSDALRPGPRGAAPLPERGRGVCELRGELARRGLQLRRRQLQPAQELPQPQAR